MSDHDLRLRPGDQQLPVPNQLPTIADLVRSDLDERRPIEHWLAILANHFGPRAQELTQDPERFAAARVRVDRVPAADPTTDDQPGG